MRPRVATPAARIDRADEQRHAQAGSDDERPGADRAEDPADPDGGVQVAGRGLVAAELAPARMTVRTPRPPNTKPATVSIRVRPTSGATTDRTAEIGTVPPRRERWPRRGRRRRLPGVAPTSAPAPRSGEPPQDHGDEGERDRVQDERERQSARRDEQAGDRRPDDEREVVERRPGAVRRPELALVADECREIRADRRAEEAREAGRQDGQRDDRPQRPVGADEPGHAPA